MILYDVDMDTNNTAPRYYVLLTEACPYTGAPLFELTKAPYGSKARKPKAWKTLRAAERAAAKARRPGLFPNPRVLAGSEADRILARG